MNAKRTYREFVLLATMHHVNVSKLFDRFDRAVVKKKMISVTPLKKKHFIDLVVRLLSRSVMT